ncbi:MAG: hypothetical protein DPW09_32975 [Anaerolineae bacterium]|nr:hypothetical protein [Anaerolineales bacterium]MCQ3978266.1 hypothetical protein [Anaerolineae bacterium]
MSKYKDYAEKPVEFLALTGYTHQEFEALLPHFEKNYSEWIKHHRLARKPRGQRAYSTYKNSPLPTIADKLFFILHDMKAKIETPLDDELRPEYDETLLKNGVRGRNIR